MRRSGYYDEDFDEFNEEEKSYYGFEEEDLTRGKLSQAEDYCDEDEIFPEETDCDDLPSDYFAGYEVSIEKDDNGEYAAFESELIGKVYSEEKLLALMDKYNNGTDAEREEAATTIYCAMMPFIKFLAKKYYSSYMPRYTEDLESAGKVGLFNNLKDYNPRKAKPTTWFSRAILHEMRDFIDSEVHHTTPHFQNHLRVIRQYINECQTKGISYTIDDIMIATGFPKQTIINCTLLYERNQNQISTEQYMGENKVSILDSLASESPDPERVAIDNESKEYIKHIMETCLTENELKVTQLRHGFFNDQTFSSSDIALKLGLRKQDIRPIMNMAERKLRRAFQKTNPDIGEKNRKTKKEKVVYLKSADDLKEEYEFEEVDL